MAFPVLNACPGLVAALWGIFYFQEIKGTKNLLIVSLAFVITIAGVICIALSN
jgi:glucose uptake protein GlcU